MSFRTQTKRTNANLSRLQFGNFVELVRRRIWIVLPIFFIVTASWIVAVNKLGIAKPQLSATAILQFDDPDALSAVDERVTLGPDAKAVLVKSRTFLEKVVHKLGLQLRVSKYPRSMIFDSVAVKLDAHLGSYNLKISNSNFELSYTDLFGKSNILKKGDIALLNQISISGLDLHWSDLFLSSPFSIKFQITNVRDAVDYIVDNLVVKTASRDGTVMSISMNGKDYEMITNIINTIADDFVSENTNTKQQRKGELLSVLEKQLQTARKDMISAEATLRRYKEKFPTIGLQDAFAPPVALLDLKETEAELKSAAFNAKSLLDRYEYVTDSNRLAILNEMVSFLSRYQTGTSEGLNAELIKLEQEHLRLVQQYAPSHMFIKRSFKNISFFGMSVKKAVNDLIIDINRKANQNSSRINKLNSEIFGLPAKQLHLSKLQRNYDVSAEIFASVLTRFNEAQIAQVVEIGDVFVVDRGVIPKEKTNFKSIFIIVGLGLLFAITLSVGPILAIGYFDGTARTEKDLKQMTDLVVLESIPVKGTWANSRTFGKTIDEKLITADYSQNFADETFRSLRAKILLSLKDIRRKRILITSLGIGEGKSFTAANLAITLAQLKISTLLIDGDLRRGVQHLHFGLQKKPGLSSILLDNAVLDPIIVQPALQSTHIQYLKLMGAGSTIANATEHLNSLRFRNLLDILSKEFEVIILDTPPVAVTTDAIGIQDVFQRYIFVVKSKHTDISELNRKIQEFPGLHKQILGIVFNGAPYKHTEYYQYSSYKYKMD